MAVDAIAGSGVTNPARIGRISDIDFFRNFLLETMVDYYSGMLR